MRVLFLQRQPCIRALKYAVALRSACPDLELCFAYQGMTLDGYYGSGDELFGAWWDLGDRARPAAELRRVLDEFAPDLVHSHNLPDSLTALAIGLVGGDVPVVHDIHDLQSLRATPYRDGFPEPADPLSLERAAIEGASAVITVSPELVEVIDARYRLPSQALVVPNLALRRDLPPIPDGAGHAGGEGIVYQGTLASDGGHYDLRDVFRRIASGGDVQLHVHPNRPAPLYEELARSVGGIALHSPLHPAALMSRLPRYRAGWAGFNTELNGAHLDTVLPNKLFEYLVSGLPVLTLRGHRALARFVDEEGVGIALDDPAQAAEAVADPAFEDLRRVVTGVRERFTFESAVGAVVDLYRSLTREPAVGGAPASGGRAARPPARGRPRPFADPHPA